MKAACAIVASACISLTSAGSVDASVIFTEGNNPQPGQENIQFESAQTGTVLTGFTNDTNTEVKFTGDGTETLVAAASGAARIEAQDGFFDYLEFNLVGSNFDSLILTIDANNSINPGNVTFFALDQFNVTHQGTFDLKPNGGNTFTITTDALQVMTKLWFTSTNELAFVDVAQFRVVPEATPVPEPASMLLLGTGLAACAAAARRRRRS